MKCPHCATSFHEGWAETNVQQHPLTYHVYAVRSLICPECHEPVVMLREKRPDDDGTVSLNLVWPKHLTRPVPPEVEEPFAGDFTQAAATLSTSTKASAALSRRVLQTIIHEKAGIKKRNLDEEIQAVIASGGVPPWLTDKLDAVRAVGNFAAHPIKSTNTGEVVDVEPGEAEFLLDVLEGLFDFYFVQPERTRGQLDAINAKLAEAGKPPLKT